MTTRVVLSVVEVAAFAGVLLWFLRRIDVLLARIQGNLGRIAEGVAAVEGHCAIIGPGTDELNRLLGQAAASLTLAAETAESLA
ncbi:MAG: hypothetical protein M3066_05545 [Actinomycetota bacterium]|nr:hypothetical protein [Actinomycetota bacterium]